MRKAQRGFLGVMVLLFAAMLVSACAPEPEEADARITISIPNVAAAPRAAREGLPDYIRSIDIAVTDGAQNVVAHGSVAATGGSLTLTIPPHTALVVTGTALDAAGQARFRGDSVLDPLRPGANQRVALALGALNPLTIGENVFPSGELIVSADSTTITTITTTAQPDQHVNFSLSGPNANMFMIGANTGVLQFASTPVPGTYQVTVAISDGFEEIARDITVTVVPPAVNSYSVGGTVTGLAGSGLVLLNNGSNALNISSNGSFIFSVPIVSGEGYTVAVGTQPTNPAQVCNVSNGSGTVGNANVTDIAVTCVTSDFTVSGSISGLTGTGLVLRNNNGGDLEIQPGAATFGFTTPVASGNPYAVTVLTQPVNPSQTCTVTNGAGIVGASNVTDVSIRCTRNSYTIGGTVIGLEGSGLELHNNASDALPISANGSFTFPTAVLSGNPYSVTVNVRPVNPSQVCTVSNRDGVVGAANVTNVVVTCATTYPVSGTVSGLAGTGLQLQLNGSNDIAIGTNGAFAFDTQIGSGSTYLVTVSSQPVNPPQNCVVANGSGTVANAAITNVSVTCATSTYTIGGSVSGLASTGLVLQNNGGDNLPVAVNGAFQFATGIAHGQTYHVTVLSTPANHTCTLQNNGPATATADVSNVLVTCSGGPPPVAPIVPMDVQPGFREVTASWTPTGATYNLYYSTAPGCDIANYTACPGGTRIAGATSPVTVGSLFNGVQYYFKLAATLGNETLYSDEVVTSPHAYVFDGSVGVIKTGELVIPGTNFYVGGSFGRVGLRSPYGAPVEIENGALAPVFPQVEGDSVATTVPDGAGGWYIGGFFSHVGGHERTGVAHILSNGTLDLQFNPRLMRNAGTMRGYVNSIVVHNNRVYIGGRFEEVNGIPYGHLAALTTDGKLDTAWNPMSDGIINTMAMGNGVLYVGGTFSTIGSKQQRFAAALDVNTGAMTAWNPQPNTEVAVMTYDSTDDTVYLGGFFTTFGTATSRPNLAQVRADGVVTDFNPGVNGRVRAIALAARRIYIGGDFTTLGGVKHWYVGSIEKSGAVNAWDPNITTSSGKVYALTASSTALYVGGDFTNAGGLSRNMVFRADLNTSTVDSVWNPSPLNWQGGTQHLLGVSITGVRALAISGSRIYLGGDFAAAQSEVRTRIAQIDGNGKLGPAVATITGSLVSDIEFAGGYMVVSGRLTNVNGQLRNSIAAFKDGVLTEWDISPIGASSFVYSLESSGTALYVAGQFNISGVDQSGARVSYVNAMQFDLGRNPPQQTFWRPLWPTGQSVNPIWNLEFAVGDLSGDLRAVGGDFSVTPRVGLARVGAVDGVVPAESVRNFNGRVYSFAGALGGDAVAGDFTSVEEITRRGLVLFTGTNGTIDTWDPNFIGAVNEILPIGKVAYVAGGFTSVGGQTDRTGLAAFTNDSNRTLTGWGPILGTRAGSLPGSAATMLQYLDRIVIGGSFSTVGGTYNDALHRNSNYITINSQSAGGLIELPP